MSKVSTGLAVLLAMLAVACSESAGDPATEPSAAAPTPMTSEAAAITEATQASEPSESASPSESYEAPSEPSEAPSEPAASEEQASAGGGALRPADPESLAEVVPVRFLPEGFVIPAGGQLAKGFGRPKAGNGTFYQQLDPRPPAVAEFLRMAYRRGGWDKVSDDSFTDNGVKGLSLLYQREFQETVGFTIVEEGGGSVLQVTYSNPPR